MICTFPQSLADLATPFYQGPRVAFRALNPAERKKWVDDRPKLIADRVARARAELGERWIEGDWMDWSDEDVVRIADWIAGIRR